MDGEGPHRRVDGQELAQPARALEGDRGHSRERRAHHAEPLARHRHEAADGPEVDRHCAFGVTRERERKPEEQRADAHEGDQARRRPARDLRREDDVDDQEEDRHEVEDPVREDGADERRPRASTGELAVQDRDARELADPAREHGVREEPDRERREDEQETGHRRGEGLADHRPPRERAREHGYEVEADRDQHPLPADDRERVADRAPARPPPPEQRADARGDGQHEQRAHPGALGRAQLHAVTAAGVRPVTSS
jgi:hypothetical protein